MKKFISIIMLLCLLATFFTACSKSGGQTVTEQNTNGKTTIRFLNFKPEIATVYDEIAKAYNQETGNKLIVETAASGNYEQTLAAKMGTEEAPTLFQINGPKGYANWKDYCADLSDTELYKHLTDKSLAVTVDGKVYGIPYVVEGYGIIYNKEITDKYFALSDKATNYKSMDEINNFASLKALVEDMQKNAEKLGIKGVFASTSLKTGEDWRWQTHLANIPVYYEFNENNVDLTGEATKTINFKYSKNFKNIFDLYINNSITEKGLLGSKSVANSMAEFALGQVCFIQNGNWGWSQISEVKGNTVKGTDIKFLPIYTGIKGEEKQGLCIGTENYLAINSKASSESQAASIDFLVWLFTSNTGKKYVTEKLGFLTPFNTFSSEEQPKDPLAQEIVRYMNSENHISIPWIFTSFPSENFKTEYGNLLLSYTQGTKTFDEVKKGVVDLWKREK